MKQNRFAKHYEGLMNTFLRYFEKSLDKQEIEDIHQLRVAMKKLRTIWSLVQFLAEGKWEKQAHFDLIDKLFDDAGDLRETQVNLEMVKKLEVPCLSTYADYLEECGEAFRIKLIHRMQRFDRKKLASLDRGLLEAMRNTNEADLVEGGMRYLARKNRKIRRIRKGMTDMRDLHRIRIRMKSIQEILHLIGELYADEELSIQHSELKKLNHDLGEWHDLCVLLGSIRNFVEHNPEEANLPALKDLIGNLHAEQEEREKQAFVVIEGYLASKL